MNFASQLHFSNKLPKAEKFKSAIIIYDKVVARKNPEFKKWVGRFAAAYAVEAGEKLKNFDQFAKHLKKLNSLVSDLSPRSIEVIAVGGGSVGDFAGFFASVYKRGVRLTHFPTTYLSAIDSAHGGKTALNLAGGKNQIGSFYPAEQVWIISSLLKSQTEAQLKDARGELAKIAVIDGKVWKLVSKGSGLISFNEFVKLMKPAIEAKMRIVMKDPLERSGVRQILNLGHTIGHVIESRSKVSHGAAVSQGLIFALRYSCRRGELPFSKLEEIEQILSDRFAIWPSPIPLKRADVTSLLRKDKKRSSKDRVNFVLLKSIGKPVVEQVEVSELLLEADRQGWIKK